VTPVIPPVSATRSSTELEDTRTFAARRSRLTRRPLRRRRAVSRVVAREPAKESTAAGDVIDLKAQMGDGVTYEQDIRQLFRDRDIQSMSFAFDLSSYDDVRANAEAIYEKLAAGSMPCDGRWPAEDVERFRTWIDNGSPP
jgi:hypothetical protein